MSPSGFRSSEIGGRVRRREMKDRSTTQRSTFSGSSRFSRMLVFSRLMTRSSLRSCSASWFWPTSMA